MTIIPNPPELGDEFTNEITGVKYKYDGIKWVVVAPEHVADNLEAVLNQGNVADKGILLTDAEDALIALAPDEATIDIASDTEKKNPRLRLTHIDNLNYPNAQAQIELDQNGTRVDFEFFQDIDECHFRFDNEEKFVLNRDGDAEFIGKVEGEPGTQNNEFVTYGQLTTLEEEIEQLAPSLERGSWVYTPNYPPAQGEYTLVKEILDEDEQEALCQATQLECIAAADGDIEAINVCNRDLIACQDAIAGTKVITTDQFVETTRIYFNDVDANGVTHAWTEIPPDHYIDIFNEADENFLVGDITSHTGGNFTIELMSSKGTANGIATVKIFRTQGTVDFDSYVRKFGDTMTGPLKIEPTSSSTNLYLKASEENPDNKNIIDVYSNQGNEIFWVDSTHVGLNTTAKTPTSSSHVITKGYADGKFVPLTGGTMTNHLYIKPTNDNTPLGIYAGPTAGDNNYLMWMYGKPFEVDGEEKRNIVFYVTAGGDIAAHSSWVPNKTNHLTTKKYVDGVRGVPYKYRFTDQKAENLQQGEFFVADNNSIYAHYRDLNGNYVGPTTGHITSQLLSQFMKVYSSTGSLLHMIEYKELRAGQGANYYMRWLYTKKLKSYSSWRSGNIYYLADGFMLPY